jgi:tryptophan synthase alpha subunit
MSSDDLLGAVQDCRTRGVLALAVYLVYGYPTETLSREAFDLLRHRGVTIIEYALPVVRFTDAPMSDAIREAHRVATTCSLDDAGILDYYSNFRPSVLIQVDDDARRTSDLIAAGALTAVDSVLTDDPELIDILTQRRGEVASPGIIQLVSAGSTTIAADLRGTSHEVVYLSIAAQTGGNMLSLDRIQHAVDSVRAELPDAILLCGFGIREGADVRRLAVLRGIDGVAVGTEALRRLANGIESFGAWVDEMQTAAHSRQVEPGDRWSSTKTSVLSHRD